MFYAYEDFISRIVSSLRVGRDNPFPRITTGKLLDSHFVIMEKRGGFLAEIDNKKRRFSDAYSMAKWIYRNASEKRFYKPRH